MRPWKRSLRSASRERLYLQGSRDKASGLLFCGRVFYPEDQKKPNHVLWFAADITVLLLVTFGLFLLMITGFHLEVSSLFYLALLLEGGITCFICRSRWNIKIKIVLAFVLIIGTAVVLFFIQEQFLDGAKSFYIQLRTTVHQTYNETDSMQMLVGNVSSMTIFLSVMGWLFSLWLSFAIYEKENFLLSQLILFPVLSVIVLSGGANHVISLFLFMFGIIGCLSVTRTIRHKRLWGSGNEALFQTNAQRYQRIQKKNLAVVFLAAIMLTIPGFYLIRPMLSVRLAPAERAALKVQSRILSKMLEVLPDITADQWNLEIKTIGGGVSEGALQDVDGYNLQGVEELQISVTDQPDETIYLKGFVGSRYTGNTWEGGYENRFDGAAMNWKIKSNPRLYIQNLPFLRTSYVLDQMTGKESDNTSDEEEKNSTETERMSPLPQIDIQPSLISVTKLNANRKYTYVPYGSFLNDYYRVEDGDGYIEGQDINDDNYYFYYREQLEEVLKVWSEMENTTNILDRVEESYRVFCYNNYLEIADGLEEIQDHVNFAIKEEKLNKDFDMTQIIAWVRAFLAENYAYDTDIPVLEEGEDFLHSFLFERKSGYSIHFASAAVELFRMFGIPSRYVVGYEAPKAIFSVQPDNTYTATLQDDNSQAWAEIYLDGIGWMPVDVTPGIVGTLEEVGPGGEKIQTYEDQKDNLKLKDQEEETEAEEHSIPDVVLSKLTQKINAILHTQMTVEEMIHFLFTVLVLIVSGIMVLIAYHVICKNYGFDPFKRRSELDRLLGVFGAYFRFFVRKGMDEHLDSASGEFIEYVTAYLNQHHRSKEVIEIIHMRDYIYACCFGDMKVTEKEIRTMRKLYLSVRLPFNL